MTRHVTVGVDGSPESAAAARWAAQEAGQRDVRLLLASRVPPASPTSEHTGRAGAGLSTCPEIRRRRPVHQARRSCAR
ncbi:universal stress protein [Streptomyces sp. NPDC057900]|uniref:universal stress protein n=1 Tax=Streptomyces sp. NPDC057900 TaxID=3346274 RepID=UPI0036E0D6F9